jgi:hypothetical protein
VIATGTPAISRTKNATSIRIARISVLMRSTGRAGPFR